MDDTIYYRHAGRLPFVTRISRRARQDVYDTFLATCTPGPETSLLDLGVSLDVTSPEANLLEQRYPWLHRVTAAGIGDGGAFAAAYPAARFVRIEPQAALPFGDGAFDLAYCNAVLEHAGSRLRQAALLAELCRVAHTVFLAVPNRWFPVEQHTGIPLLPFLPLALGRRLLRLTPLRYWAEEDHLNPLSAGDLAALVPPGRRAVITGCGLLAGPLASNLAARITPA